VVLLVLDAADGLRPDDQEVVRWLHKTSRETPVLGVVNKVDHPSHSEATAEFYTLGLTLVEVSAEHGIGIEKLLDAIRERVDLPDVEEVERAAGKVRAASSGTAAPSRWR
jgi:predicted GTPase